MGLLPVKIISLDIDEGSVIAVELARSGKDISLVNYRVSADLDQAIEAFSRKETPVAINLPTQSVLFRTFHLSSSFLKSKNKEKEITSFLLHQNLPFKLEECFWDTFMWDSTLILIAAKKEVVSKYIAQIESLKGQVYSITASQVALYNVFIHSYPEEKERFVLLNVRISASDLLFYEDKRVNIYPVSLGKKNITEESGNKEKFADEIQKVFTSHYLQYPMNAAKAAQNTLYVSGQESSYGFIFALKKALGDFEVKMMNPLAHIGSSSNIENTESFSLACGVGLGHLEAPGCINTNLFKIKIREREKASMASSLKVLAMGAGVLFIIILGIVYRNIFKDFERYAFMYGNTEFQVSSQMPQVKNIKEKKEILQKYRDYLENKLQQDKLNYLKAMAVIAESKPYSVAISNLVVQAKERKDIKAREAEAPVSASKSREFVFKPNEPNLQVFVSGTGSGYEDVNAFLGNLKKAKEAKDARIIASTFPSLESKTSTIDFKIGFEVPVKQVKIAKQEKPGALKKVTAVVK